MQMTTRTDNAIKIMLYLAAQMEDRWVPASEIGSAIAASGFVVQKIVLDLSLANLLSTSRGRYGGIKLKRDLADIPLSEVVAVGERETGWKFTECDRRPDCDCYLSGGKCTLRAMYRNVQEQIMGIFGGITLAQLRTKETDQAAREHYANYRSKAVDDIKVNVNT
ncbi:RrF2 family transcriptional regulator [Rhizobium panacihumi]|uniref:RrF2 family transcriptional regulator n=1 Tax=Rhizobium panacihumi TaxID=2008450 RepID=UPI003D797217